MKDIFVSAGVNRGPSYEQVAAIGRRVRDGMGKQMMVGGDLDERAPETDRAKRSQDEQQCGVGQKTATMLIDRSEVTMGQSGRGTVSNSQVYRPDP
jgi:hypothetical protein